MNKRVRLSDLTRITHGYAFDGAGFTGEDTGNILITPGNFSIGGGFKLDKPKYFRGEVPERFVLKPGDLVVTMTDLSKSMDTLGCVAIIPELADGARALHNQRVGKFHLISDEVDPGYLAYRLRGRDYLAEVRASSSGSTVHHTSPGRIEKFEFDLPPLAEQRAIAATLGALDDKIESNRTLRQLLIDLSEAEFDKLLSLGATQFVRLGDVVDHRPGKYLAKQDYGHGTYRVYGSNSVMGFHDKALYEGPFAVLARIGNAGALRWSEDSAWVNNNASALIPKAESSPWMLRHALNRIDMSRFKSGSVQPFIEVRALMNSEIELPSQILIDSTSELFRVASKKESALAKEEASLAALRDALLPELLSGRIRLGEAAA